MISAKGFSLLLSVLVVVSTTAQAADKFSVQDWKESFSKAVAKNDSGKIEQLTNFKKLEEKAIPECTDCDTKKKVRLARDLFAKADFAAAEKLYNQVPKGSDLWLEAVEERGWSHFRRDDFEKTLAQTKTLLSPQFVGAVNSEAYFLQSLAQLKICDYEGILETHKNFKEKQRSRITEIQDLAKTGVNESLKKVIAQTKTFPLKFEDMGEALTTLPLLFYRDLEVQRNLLKLKVAQAALTVVPEGKVAGSKIDFVNLKNESSEKLQSRIKFLAEQENTENSKIVQKLNLVEVEAIQRIHTDMKLSDNMYKQGEFKKTTDDQLVFMDDGRPWIDELDKYDVAAKSCAKNIRRKM